MYFRVSSTSKSSYYISYISTLLTMHGSQLFLANSIIFAALCPSSNECVVNCRNLLANMLNRAAMLSQYVCICIHTGMVTLWCSTAMVVYSDGCIQLRPSSYHYSFQSGAFSSYCQVSFTTICDAFTL